MILSREYYEQTKKDIALGSVATVATELVILKLNGVP